LNWDGNIRELRNVLARLSLSGSGHVIDKAVVEAICGEKSGQKTPADDGSNQDLHDIQRAHVLSNICGNRQQHQQTARRLGVSRNTVYRALRGRRT